MARLAAAPPLPAPPSAAARAPRPYLPPSNLPPANLRDAGWGIWQVQNATHATWNWHTSVVNAGPAGWTDSLTIVQTGRGH